MNTIPTKDLIAGQTYDLDHCRFGRATVQIINNTDSDFIETEVVAGVLRGLNSEWLPGDEKAVRREHCKFYPVQAADKLRRGK